MRSGKTSKSIKSMQPLIGVRWNVFRTRIIGYKVHPRAGSPSIRIAALTTVPSDTMQATRLALKSHLIVERDSSEDDIVLINSRSGRMTACNETASVLIAQLQKGSTVDRLIEMLTTNFRVTDEVATRDVNALLDVLAAEGLLETPD
jgi:Coenzyme PQQ synthesis protein D (PqqD)